MTKSHNTLCFQEVAGTIIFLVFYFELYENDISFQISHKSKDWPEEAFKLYRYIAAVFLRVLLSCNLVSVILHIHFLWMNVLAFQKTSDFFFQIHLVLLWLSLQLLNYIVLKYDVMVYSMFEQLKN